MGERRWLVCSPPRSRYYPPEPFAHVVEVEALTRRDALVMASKTPEMQDYATEMRGDNRPPWYGLTAEPLATEPQLGTEGETE